MLFKTALGALLFVAAIVSINSDAAIGSVIVDDFEEGAEFVHWARQWGEAVWERLEYSPDDHPELPVPFGSGLVSLVPPSHGQGSIDMELGGVQLESGASLRITYWTKELVAGAMNFYIRLEDHKLITLTGNKDPTQFTSRTEDLEVPAEGIVGKFSMFAYLSDPNERIVIDEISICTSAEDDCQPLELATTTADAGNEQTTTEAPEEPKHN